MIDVKILRKNTLLTIYSCMHNAGIVKCFTLLHLSIFLGGLVVTHFLGARVP